MALQLVEANENQCEWTTEKGRRCKLSKGHALSDKTPHGHMTVIRKETRTSLSDVKPDGFRLKAKKVAPGVPVPKVINRQSSIARDEDQKAIDKDAAAVFAEWLKTSPKEWIDWPKNQYEVPKTMTETLLDYIRATVNNGGPCPGKVMRYRMGTADSGDVLITWGIGDVKE